MIATFLILDAKSNTTNRIIDVINTPISNLGLPVLLVEYVAPTDAVGMMLWNQQAGWIALASSDLEVNEADGRGPCFLRKGIAAEQRG